ncbi:uncharacterized protein EAE98_009954 [Botrytis deweyae]|uniref:BTB domain-containing protein n=1 Tax=Botrytis deweyae TaxID=2478750 RepID=A0ABQ7I9Y8_9HELO|nr:uncharacterized protein EAE98_009954 [Botrytis deweyae]KAF7917926.1 hypothetical protein EAE98_009954 [Botrytis deweyae]
MAGDTLSDGGSAPQMQIKKYVVLGQLPDTRFRLFGKIEIHAHSILLKMHSAFFRKFMDSPDKVPSKAGAAFVYEWVDEVDDDGSGWHVVADSNKKSSTKLSEGISEPATEVFVSMLNCIYRIPFGINSKQLIKLTKLADYYRCLPAVSNNLYACFYMSPKFDIRRACNLIESAYKLRQPLLFRDCIVYIAGTMQRMFQPQSLYQDKNSSMQQALQQALMTVRNKILEIHLDAQEAVYTTAGESTELFETMKEVSIKLMEDDFFHHPHFCRKLADREEEFSEALKEVLSGNLQLDSSAVAGIGEYRNNFFCASLSDEELPWDTTETDW